LKKWKIIAIAIPLSIVLFFPIVFLVNSYTSSFEYDKIMQESEELEMNSPLIEVTGVVVHVVSIEGPNYQLIPEPSELSKFGDAEIASVNLGASVGTDWISDALRLTSDLEGKKVKVKGVFIENPIGFHVQYSTVKPVVVVKELTVLDYTPYQFTGKQNVERVGKGLVYIFEPDEVFLEELNKFDFKEFYLVGNALDPNAKRISIEAHIIEDFDLYKKGVWDGNFQEFEGPVIYVTRSEKLE